MGQNPGVTIFGIMSLIERKIFLVITIKSISQTTPEMLLQYNKTNFYYINNNYHQCFCFLKNTLDVALKIYLMIKYKFIR